jgi:hypothetical protein
MRYLKCRTIFRLKLTGAEPLTSTDRDLTAGVVRGNLCRGPRQTSNGTRESPVIIGSVHSISHNEIWMDLATLLGISDISTLILGTLNDLTIPLVVLGTTMKRASGHINFNRSSATLKSQQRMFSVIT